MQALELMEEAVMLMMMMILSVMMEIPHGRRLPFIGEVEPLETGPQTWRTCV